MQHMKDQEEGWWVGSYSIDAKKKEEEEVSKRRAEMLGKAKTENGKLEKKESLAAVEVRVNKQISVAENISIKGTKSAYQKQLLLEIYRK